jgi:hypothetical protein
MLKVNHVPMYENVYFRFSRRLFEYFITYYYNTGKSLKNIFF